MLAIRYGLLYPEGTPQLVLVDPLDDELEGFYKMRVENCRLILKHESGEKAPLFKVVFAERRSPEDTGSETHPETAE